MVCSSDDDPGRRSTEAACGANAVFLAACALASLAWQALAGLVGRRPRSGCWRLRATSSRASRALNSKTTVGHRPGPALHGDLIHMPTGWRRRGRASTRVPTESLPSPMCWSSRSRQHTSMSLEQRGGGIDGTRRPAKAIVGGADIVLAGEAEAGLKGVVIVRSVCGRLGVFVLRGVCGLESRLAEICGYARRPGGSSTWRTSAVPRATL